MGLFRNKIKEEIRTLQLQIDSLVEELVAHEKEIGRQFRIILNQNQIIEHLKIVIEAHVQNHKGITDSNDAK